jgi:hypothetical protein
MTSTFVAVVAHDIGMLSIRKYFSFVLFLVTIDVAGCGTPAVRPVTVSCRAPAEARLSADSSFGLCLPAGFERLHPDASPGADAWRRGTPEASGYAWLTVQVLDSAAAAGEWGVPPTPPSFRDRSAPGMVDATSAESVGVHRTMVGGRAVDIESALLTGGVSGVRRQLALRAVWAEGDGRWVIVQGRGNSAAAVDSLRADVGSLVVRAVPSR